MCRLLPLLLAACVVVGCGGEDEGGSPAAGGAASVAAEPAGAAPAARKAYIKSSDAICRRANDRIAPLNARFADVQRRFPQDQARQTAAAREAAVTGARVAREALADLRGLTVPAGDEQAIAALDDSRGRQAAAIAAMADAARDGDWARFREQALGAQRIAVETRSRSQAYGFRECGALSTGSGTSAP